MERCPSPQDCLLRLLGLYDPRLALGSPRGADADPGEPVGAGLHRPELEVVGHGSSSTIGARPPPSKMLVVTGRLLRRDRDRAGWVGSPRSSAASPNATSHRPQALGA